jgi:hypothetical protein
MGTLGGFPNPPALWLRRAKPGSANACATFACMSKRLLAVRCAVAVLGIGVASPVATASLVRALDLTALIADADRIVVADVVSVQAAWDATHRSIHTTVEIAVRESWKGDVPVDGRLTIRQPGGTVGDIEMTVRGMPVFAAGERSLLFLHRAHVVGMSQGKRNLRWQAAEKRWLVAPADHAEVVALGPDGRLRATLPAGAETLDELRTRVRSLVGK